MTTATLDQAGAQAFAGRLLKIVNDGMPCLMVSVGHRTGLFDAMADGTARTSAQPAERAGLSERYVREWLGAMVTGRIVDYDPKQRTYALPGGASGIPHPCCWHRQHRDSFADHVSAPGMTFQPRVFAQVVRASSAVPRHILVGRTEVGRRKYVDIAITTERADEKARSRSRLRCGRRLRVRPRKKQGQTSKLSSSGIRICSTSRDRHWTAVSSRCGSKESSNCLRSPTAQSIGASARTW